VLPFDFIEQSGRYPDIATVEPVLRRSVKRFHVSRDIGRIPISALSTEHGATRRQRDHRADSGNESDFVR
jgi:hypothetical protein